MSQNPSLVSLTEALQLHIASFLPPRDLLSLACVCHHYAANLDTDALWKHLCTVRWEPWPRYRLTTERLAVLDTTLMPNTSWKERYLVMEREATRTTLQSDDLCRLSWYLSFVLSGIRGEGRSDHVPIQFVDNAFLMVPQFPPLPYRIVNEPPGRPPTHIRPSLRGDQPFSTTQWLDINGFPTHYITRQASTAEWLIVNENVIMVSGPPR